MDLLPGIAPTHVLACVALACSLPAAKLIADGTDHHFLAHVLYSVANGALLLTFALKAEWLLALQPLAFSYTSLRGCVRYRPRARGSESRAGVA